MGDLAVFKATMFTKIHGWWFCLVMQKLVWPVRSVYTLVVLPGLSCVDTDGPTLSQIVGDGGDHHSVSIHRWSLKACLCQYSFGTMHLDIHRLSFVWTSSRGHPVYVKY